MLAAYGRELGFMVGDGTTFGSRVRFAEKWHDLVRRRVAHRLAFCDGPASTNVERQLVRSRVAAMGNPDPATEAALEARVGQLESRLAQMEERAADLHELLDHVAGRRRHVIEQLRALQLDGLVGASGAGGAVGGEREGGAECGVDGDSLDGVGATVVQRAFPALEKMHGGPGLLHLFKFGVLGVVFKIYFAPLIHFAGHTILMRKNVSAAVKHFFACDALFYRISDAIFTLMVEAHQTDPIYTDVIASITDIGAYHVNFVAWYKSKVRSGDVPFIFYSQFALGVGLLYRACKQSMSMRDNLMAYALMLPAMGAFKIAGKHNLTFNAFLSMVRVSPHPRSASRASLPHGRAASSARCLARSPPRSLAHPLPRSPPRSLATRASGEDAHLDRGRGQGLDRQHHAVVQRQRLPRARRGRAALDAAGPRQVQGG